MKAGNGDASFQELRRGLVVRLIAQEAAELERAWAQLGWVPPVSAHAERCANTLIAVFGAGPYRIVHIHRR
jgi:hypothetical protein